MGTRVAAISACARILWTHAVVTSEAWRGGADPGLHLIAAISACEKASRKRLELSYGELCVNLSRHLI